ncbi:MAG TPA: PA2779 family protein [Candidatus Angelobacter sp.]
MSFGPRQSVRILIACFFTVLFAIPPDVLAQDHVVKPSDLQQEIIKATQTRQHNLETLQSFLSTPAAEKALKSAKLDPQQVKTAVAMLSDDDVAQLSSRAEKAQSDFAAGRISDRDLIWIIVAIVALILIIVAVR